MAQRQHIEPSDQRIIAELLRRIEAARRFPDNTDPCVRHVEIMGELLCRGLPYPMLDEERGHCAISLLSVVADLYEARNAASAASASQVPQSGNALRYCCYGMYADVGHTSDCKASA